MTKTIPLIAAEVLDRQRARANPQTRAVWELLDAVVDPEIPVLSLWDLGVLQAVEMKGEEVVVTLTPTYTGCPAMEVMMEAVQERLNAAGYTRARVELRLAPAWTTNWMSEAGRLALEAYGIAPPGDAVSCPQCGSGDVHLLSEFGSTACKSLYRCAACSEPFDHFKKL